MWVNKVTERAAGDGAAADDEADDVVPGEGAVAALPESVSKNRFCGKHGLATWNGAWGVLEIQKASDLPLDTLLSRLKQEPVVIQLWDEFKTWSETWDLEHKAEDVSLQMEMSTASDDVRLHLHKYFSLEKALDWKTTALLTFKGSRPDLKMNHARGDKQEKSVNRGHYYASAPKVGKVFGHTTKTPHYDYPVDPAWPTSLWVVRKMSHKSYRKEIVNGRQQVLARLRNLDVVLQAEKEMVEDDQMREGLAQLPVYKSRTLAQVQNLQAELGKVRHRFRFLVLCGPSGLGKTEYVKALHGAAATYECDCSNTATPDLKEYSWSNHKVVLFDEASPSMVLQNKKLFQAHISPAILGQTTTGHYSYKVWVWRRLLVVTTNSWDLSGLAPADQAWLNANSCVVKVDLKLYEEPPASKE